jgi:TP901 family phage tail tape measure protein
MTFSSSGNHELAVEITADDEGASDAFDGVADSASGVKTAVLGASAALAGAGVAALGKATQAAMNFESAMVEVEKVTNPKTAEEMSSAIRDMATEIPMAQKELAGLAADAGRFGIEGPENIEQFTRSVAKMATATELNAQEAGESLAKLSELTNTPISEVENLGSSINALSNNFATSSQEIVDSMMRSAGAMSQMGFSQTQIAGMSAALNEVSESSERAGTRMRRLSQEMMNPKKAGALADALGMTKEEFTQMRKNSPKDLMMTLAETMKEGEEGADALRNSLSTTSRQALSALSQNLDGARGALEQSNDAYKEGTSLQKEFNAQTDTFKSQLKLVRNQLQNIAIVMGNRILPILSDGLKALRPMISGFANFNKALNGLPAVIAASSAAILGLAGVVATLGISVTATLLPAIAVVGALAAAGYAVYKAWQTNFAGIRDVVKNTIATVRQTLENNEGTINSIRQTVLKLWGQFKQAFHGMKAVLKFVVQNYTIPLIRKLRDLWKTHFGDMATETQKTMAMITSRIQTAGKLISKFWDRYGSQIMTITKATFDFLVLTIGTALDAIMTSVKVILALLRGDWKQAFSYIKGFATRTFDKIVSFLQGSFLKSWKAGLTLIFKVVKDVFTAIYEFLIGNSIVPETFNAILKFIRSNFLGGLKSALGAIFGTFKDIFGNIKSNVESTISGLASSVLSSMRSLGGQLVGEMRDTVRGMRETFNGAIPDRLSVPRVTVGGGSVGIPEELGGGRIGLPSETIGGQSINMPHLADGGIVEQSTIAMIGEAGDEAVVPLERLGSYLDTAYEAGTSTAVERTPGTGSSSGDTSFTARLRVEGEGALADIIRENAEIAIEEHEREKSDRLSRI